MDKTVREHIQGLEQKRNERASSSWMKAMQAGAMNWKRSFEQSSLRYVFITMRLRLSADYSRAANRTFAMNGGFLRNVRVIRKAI